MGRHSYRFRDRELESEKKRELHPIWRGVGCVLLILLALGGYWFGGWFIANNRWIYLPPELFNPDFVPAFLPSGIVLRLALGFLFMLLGYGVLSFFYAVAFPIKPGETDAPPIKRKRRSSSWRSHGR